jgi:hypothetical protein
MDPELVVTLAAPTLAFTAPHQATLLLRGQQVTTPHLPHHTIPLLLVESTLHDQQTIVTLELAIRALTQVSANPHMAALQAILVSPGTDPIASTQGQLVHLSEKKPLMLPKHRELRLDSRTLLVTLQTPQAPQTADNFRNLAATQMLETRTRLVFLSVNPVPRLPEVSIQLKAKIP